MKKAEYSFTGYTWRQFKKNKAALLSIYMLIGLIIISLLSDLIANGQPLYAKYRGRNFFPAFATFFNKTLTDSTLNPATNKYEKLQFDITDWRQLPLERVIWAPIPYSSSQRDKYNSDFVAPGALQHYKNGKGEIKSSPYILRHHLGTDAIGGDVAAGLVHGIGVALRVGLLSVAIAAAFGIILGTISGFFGDYRIVINMGAFLLALPGLFLGIFYGFVVRAETLKEVFDKSLFLSLFQLFISLFITAFFTFLFGWAGHYLKKTRFFSRKIFVPFDIIISRLMELFDSIPPLVFIITVSALFIDKSLSLVIIIIGFLSIPQIARLTRAEFIRIRNLDYIQSARALGIRSPRIIIRHILPNALAPVFVALAFGAASAIIAESSLSFLGIGVQADTVTWGSLLSYSRDDFNAWWMVVFPGFAIFITVTMFNLIGEGLRQALDPRGRR